MKLYFGKVQGNRYVIEINRTGDPVANRHEVDLKVVDSDSDCIYSITRQFSDNWGKWTDDALKRSVLNEYKEDME